MNAIVLVYVGTTTKTVSIMCVIFVDDLEMMIGQDFIWIKFVHQLNELNIIIHA